LENYVRRQAAWSGRTDASCFQVILRDMQAATGLGKPVIMSLLGPILALAVFLDVNPQALCTVVGVSYPAWASIRAIESHDKSDGRWGRLGATDAARRRHAMAHVLGCVFWIEHYGGVSVGVVGVVRFSLRGWPAGRLTRAACFRFTLR
jgi:hypothetical protein